MQTQTDTLMRRAEKLNAAHLMTNLWIVTFNGSMNGRSDGKTKRTREISDVSVDGQVSVRNDDPQDANKSSFNFFFDLFFGKSPLNVCEFMVIWDCITVSLNIEVHTPRISRNVNGILKQKRRKGEEALKRKPARPNKCGVGGRYQSRWAWTGSSFKLFSKTQLFIRRRTIFPTRKNFFRFGASFHLPHSFINSNVKFSCLKSWRRWFEKTETSSIFALALHRGAAFIRFLYVLGWEAIFRQWENETFYLYRSWYRVAPFRLYFMTSLAENSRSSGVVIVLVGNSMTPTQRASLHPADCSVANNNDTRRRSWDRGDGWARLHSLRFYVHMTSWRKIDWKKFSWNFHSNELEGLEPVPWTAVLSSNFNNSARSAA